MRPYVRGLNRDSHGSPVRYATQKPLFDRLHRELAPAGGRLQMLARIGYPKTELRPAPRRGLAAQLKRARWRRNRKTVPMCG